MNNSNQSFKKNWKQKISKRLLDQTNSKTRTCVFMFHEPTNPKLKKLEPTDK